jgi:hypothetical protein
MDSIAKMQMRHCVSCEKFGEITAKKDYEICRMIVEEMLAAFKGFNHKGVWSNVLFNTYDGKRMQNRATLKLSLFEGMDDNLHCEYDDRFKANTALEKRIANRLKRFEASMKMEFKKKNILMKRSHLNFPTP